MILTVSHDPKLDDMALIEALKSEAFYVGSVGSVRTSAERRKRLAGIDAEAEEVEQRVVQFEKERAAKEEREANGGKPADVAETDADLASPE